MNDRKQLVLTIISGIFTALNILALLIFTGFMIFQRPYFTEMYMDFGVALPVPTQILISLPAWPFLFAGLTITGLLIVKELIPNKGMALILNLVWAVIAIAVTALTAVALLAPIKTVTEAVESSGAASGTVTEDAE